MQRASLKRVSKRKKEEAISYISSYQTLTADKNSKSYQARTKLKKSGRRYATIAVNLLKLMRALEIIGDETHDCERVIFTRCAMECEGLEGTIESSVGSINFASWFATGENYVLRKVKRGVNYLGDILSGGIGMNDTYTISLHALLGNRTFTVMMKSIFNLDMDGLAGDFLVRLKHESRKMHDRESYQRNVNDRKELEQRVSNGDKLDTAEEATWSKLTAAYESHNKNHRESYQSIVDDWKDLEQRISNGDKLDTVEEATLSKLLAAHGESSKLQRYGISGLR